MNDDKAKDLLIKASDAIYSVLCESNGIGDNEWTFKDGTEVKCEFPVESFVKALQHLEDVYVKILAYLDPTKAAEEQRWHNACMTATYLINRYDESTEIHQNLRKSSLQRNIADAIFGVLKVTPDNLKPTTLTDKINQLVKEGKLVDWNPEDYIK